MALSEGGGLPATRAGVASELPLVETSFAGLESPFGIGPIFVVPFPLFVTTLFKFKIFADLVSMRRPLSGMALLVDVGPLFAGEEVILSAELLF